MSEVINILTISVHENGGIGIELALDEAKTNPLVLVGILEQIKYDLLKDVDKEIRTLKNKPSKFDA
jgi:hypothetical protein